MLIARVELAPSSLILQGGNCSPHIIPVLDLLLCVELMLLWPEEEFVMHSVTRDESLNISEHVPDCDQH